MAQFPDMTAALALNRFGLGSRPGQLHELGVPAKRWLLDQIAGPSRVPSVLADLPPSAQTLGEVQKLRMERRAMVKAGEQDKDNGLRETVRNHYRAQVHARTQAAVATEHPFFERLVHFWSNHFAISADKQWLPAIAASMENEVVRPGLGGSFAQLLIAAEQHPSMLLYLDNQTSTGANSKTGRRVARRRPDRNVGLNENLAREVLELHTLGVDGGYDQSDVTSFARVLTGWSVGRRGKETGRFSFNANLHEPGAQLVMGKRYRQDGVAQGEAVLSDLAAHPSTARHIATKLARHMVADAPPPVLVDHLVDTFQKTGGSLPALHRALVEHDAAWAPDAGKYKTPHDLVLSTFRALKHVPAEPRTSVAAYNLLGQSPFRPGSPAGWPDTADDWRGGNALYQRIEWVNTVARRAARAVDPQKLAVGVLGPTLSPTTQRALSRAQSKAQALTLLFASPDFQRR